MKKIIIKLLLLIMVFSALFSAGTKNAYAADDKFDVKINVGYNDNYKIGYSTPVNITIKNKYKDINGEVEIRVPSTPGKYISYVKPISLQKDAEKVITINIPISVNRTNHTLNIYDGGTKVYEDTVTTVASNNITTFLGILSDDFDSLSYINQVPASAGGSWLNKVIKLDEKNFPDDIFTLKAFDVIVINDFDTSRLSKSQYDVLKQWVAGGGTLLIGTGSKYNKTLSIFKDDFIVGTQGSVQTISTSKIYELATNGENKNETTVDALSMSIKDSKTVMEDKGVKLVQTLNKGKGVIGIAAFDMGQAPFVNWVNRSAFAEKLLGLINPEFTAIKNNPVDYIQNNTYMVRNAMNQFSEMSTARTSSFYLILFIYVIVVAPLSYFVLKKMDKRELMWITVPVFSVIFAVAVYISGSGTRLSEITTNMISLLNIDEKGNATSSTYAGIFNANKMTINITGKNNEKIIPLSDNINLSSSQQQTGKEVMEAKVLDSQGGVEYRNSSLLETRILQLQEGEQNVGKIETDLSFKNGLLAGTIKNSTILDLADCLIILPESYFRISSIKSGETINLSGYSAKNYSIMNGGLHQIISQEFYSYNSYSAGLSDNERKKRMDNMQQGQIMDMLFNNGNQSAEGINLIAFSKTQIHGPLIVNGKEVKKNERNILFFPLYPEFTNGESLDYPFGFVPYTILNTSNLNYDTYGKRFYGNGFAEIQYQIDKNMKVDEIELNSTNMNIKSVAGSPGISIFNPNENAYELLGKTIIKEEDLKKYLAQDNTVKIKLELRDMDSAVPAMAARGKKK